MQHLRRKGSLSLLAATLTKNIPGGGGGGWQIHSSFSLASNIFPPTSRAPAMTRRHNTANGDSSSARPTLLRHPMVNVTFVLRLSHSLGRDCILEFEAEP